MDAVAVSKRVAESVLTQEVVEAHANAQIAANNDPEKWKFFLTASKEHDTEKFLLPATKPWVEEYLSQLKGISQRDVDFFQDEWWK